MAGVVVPYRGPDGKSRLELGSGEARRALAETMLADVVAACAAVGRTLVVTPGPVPNGFDVELVPDPGGGQGAAVAAGLERLDEGPALVVNADLPAATPRDLLALLGATPPRGIALVAATDGTTNALSLASPRLFAPLYGPGSAKRFAEHARSLGVPFAAVDVPNLAADVDTYADLVRAGAAA